MNFTQLKILFPGTLTEFKKKATGNLSEKFESLTESELSIDDFSFYTSVAVVYSSRIEGEMIELDSYIKHKKFGIEFLPDYTRKVDDLYEAYQFAKKNPCNRLNIEKAHQFLTKNILPDSRQGKPRSSNMFVTTPDGKIEYVAAVPEIVAPELGKFYDDLKLLLAGNLDITEVFYFASMLHLVFVKIHPFDDGNGRTARLIEKWFLSEKLGEKAWLLESEKYYYSNHQLYYKNIRLLGLEYPDLNYSNSLPFLMMLTNSLEQ
jgi:Fic family protein